MIRIHMPLAALALTALVGCTSQSALLGEPEVMRFTQEIPRGAAPNACWGKQVTPAVIETETRQVLVQPAEIRADGNVTRPAVYRTETVQRIVQERVENWFETPCENQVDEAFIASLQRALAVRLTRLVMPALLMLGLSTLTLATLHAQRRFTLPALSDASFRAGPLIFLLAVGNVVGMAVGVVLGALGKLVIETFGLRRYLRRVRPTLDLHFPPGRTVGRLAAPLLFGLTFSLFIGPLIAVSFYKSTAEIAPIFLIAVTPAIFAFFATAIWLPSAKMKIAGELDATV